MLLDQNRMYEAAKAAVTRPELADHPDLLGPTFKAYRDHDGVHYAILSWQVEPPPDSCRHEIDLLRAVWRIEADYTAVPVTDSRARHRVLNACRLSHHGPAVDPIVRVRVRRLES